MPLEGVWEVTESKHRKDLIGWKRIINFSNKTVIDVTLKGGQFHWKDVQMEGEGYCASGTSHWGNFYVCVVNKDHDNEMMSYDYKGNVCLSKRVKDYKPKPLLELYDKAEKGLILGGITDFCIDPHLYHKTFHFAFVSTNKNQIIPFGVVKGEKLVDMGRDIENVMTQSNSVAALAVDTTRKLLFAGVKSPTGGELKTFSYSVQLKNIGELKEVSLFKGSRPYWPFADFLH